VRLSLAFLWSGEAKSDSHLEPGCASLAKHGYLVAGLAANFIYCWLRGGSSWKRYVRTVAYALRADLDNFLSARVSGLKRGSVRMRGLSADIVAKVGGCEGAAQRRTCSQGSKRVFAKSIAGSWDTAESSFVTGAALTIDGGYLA
jgi:hypothetical protein